MHIISQLFGGTALRRRITAVLISIGLAASFVPCVGASAVSNVPDVSDTDLQAAQSLESTSQSAETTGSKVQTTSAAESTVATVNDTTQSSAEVTRSTQSVKSFTQTSAQSGGFENVQTDGGVLLVGTARIPKSDGSVAAVKFVYSSSLNLNDKSLALINKELAACGVTIPNGMIYVSASDTVSDSQLMTSTSEQQAVFACGSESAPTVLKAYRPYSSVEESFERMFPGYIFSISGYTSLRSVLDGRDEVTLSEDGQTASTSIVMSEDYVEKVINGKKIKILMINSELKYYFRAPKLVFEKDEDYNVSDSDVVYHYPTRSTTDPSDTLTTAATQSTTVSTESFFEDDTDTTQDTTQATSATTQSTESTTEPTEASTKPFIDDETTDAILASTDATEAVPTEATSATTQTTVPTTSPTGMIPYARPINPLPTQSTTESTVSTTTKATLPTTESTTAQTTNSITLPTTTQPTNNSILEPTIDPFSQKEQHSVGEAYVNTKRLPLNIRSGPGLNYMIVKVLPKGTRLTVLDTSNSDWYMVRLQNRTVGYAYSRYIKFY